MKMLAWPGSGPIAGRLSGVPGRGPILGAMNLATELREPRSIGLGQPVRMRGVAHRPHAHPTRIQRRQLGLGVAQRGTFEHFDLRAMPAPQLPRQRVGHVDRRRIAVHVRARRRMHEFGHAGLCCQALVQRERSSELNRCGGALPVAVYAFDLMMCGVAYVVLQAQIITLHGDDSVLAKTVGDDLKG